MDEQTKAGIISIPPSLGDGLKQLAIPKPTGSYSIKQNNSAAGKKNGKRKRFHTANDELARNALGHGNQSSSSHNKNHPTGIRLLHCQKPQADVIGPAR
ncbi:hypothetical protein [Ferrimonas sediminum]|uniref:hypothetical protein n=1 Tax=Ferrimonas sediminum TaxID=718193 RepID=UPI00115FC5D2|nr:hypothetical protein [Ferrimonas sediminum]